MKKQVRLSVTILLLVVSVACFLGNILQFQFKNGLKGTLMGNAAELAAEIAGDEEILEEDLSTKEAIDSLLDSLEDRKVEKVMDTVLSAGDADTDEVLADIKAALKTMRDSGVSYLEMAKLLNFAVKYDSSFHFSEDDIATANGIKIFCYVMVGLAIFWAVLSALLALKNKGFGFVLYLIHAVINLGVAALGKYLFESIDDDVVTVLPMAPVVCAVVALITVIFWFSTKKKVVEE